MSNTCLFSSSYWHREEKEHVDAAVSVESPSPPERNQWQPPEHEQQDFPFNASLPSLRIRGTIARAARGSAHHQPKPALSRSPQRRIADRYEQSWVWVASAFIAALSIPRATCLFARAKMGTVITENRATRIPGKLRPGASCRMSEEAESKTCKLQGRGNTRRQFST